MNEVEPQKKKSVAREYAEAIVTAVILALILRAFVIQAFKIPSSSMEPTLLVGDHILVNKFIYGIKVPFTNTHILSIREPKRGDIIVFPFPLEPRKDFIKRIIGLPGETIRIVNKKIYINSKLFNDPYGFYINSGDSSDNENSKDNLGPIKIPPSCYFVMGDNRDRSYDSRFWGFVKKEDIKGKAFIIYWSNDNHFYKVRWNRIGKLIK